MRIAASPRTGTFAARASLTDADPRPEIRLADSSQIHPVAARAGDHLEIHRLLQNVFRGPSSAEFAAQADAPGYDPAQRIVAWWGREIAAHVRWSPANVQFGPVQLPACTFMDLATALPLRGRGLASAVTAEGENRAAAAGVVLALTRTTAVDFFQRLGWTICGRHSYSVVNPCRLLAALADRYDALPPESVLRPRPQRNWNVRPFRRLDLDAVMRLERQGRDHRYGAFERDEARWEWLLARQAFDRIYVAAENPTTSDVSGYVVACEGRIGELRADPRTPAAAERLLAHICREGVESGLPAIRYDGPQDDPVHALAQAAGGRQVYEPTSAGETYCVKVLNPRRLLELTSPVWAAHAAARPDGARDLTIELCEPNAERPAVFHLCARSGVVDDERFETPSRGRLRIPIPAAQLGPLVLGQLAPGERERILGSAAAKHRPAETLAAFFPPLPWYLPSWEQWTAR